MDGKPRIVFFGELESYYSRAHYIALREAQVVLWVASHNPLTGSISPRKAFWSARDLAERLSVRAGFEVEMQRHFGRPMALLREPNVRLHFTRSKFMTLAEQIRELEPDLIVSAGFRKILPPSILELPKLGAFNCHPSPLPRYAGSNPWFWILLNGEKQTAVTIHQMVATADAGDILGQQWFPVDAHMNYQQLYNRSTILSAVQLRKNLRFWSKGIQTRMPQDLSQRTYFRVPHDSDYQINWGLPAERILNLVRAAAPAPGAWTTMQGQRLIILRARRAAKHQAAPGTIVQMDRVCLCVACGDDAVQIDRVALRHVELPMNEVIPKLGLYVGATLR